jgi:hypothetical protein
MLRIAKVNELVPATHTVLGWDVNDIAEVSPTYIRGREWPHAATRISVGVF